MNVVVIQARMGSSRLPGKVMMDLNGAPVLAHVLARAGAVPGVDRVCCAIPDPPENDALAALAARLGATVTRGSETDVLDRYLQAARACEARTVMRITSDCPVIDPEVSGRVLAAFHATGSDYASNIDPRSWPKGLDTEVFSREALERAAAETADPYDREHVTPYLRRAEGMTRTNLVRDGEPRDAWRWTLDYPQDLEFLRGLLSHVPPLPHLAGFDALARVHAAHPELARINGHLV
jgi:spore coat polysaccharide biosynthesis protein SpsF (cytidylyltransferase family)